MEKYDLPGIQTCSRGMGGDGCKQSVSSNENVLLHYIFQESSSTLKERAGISVSTSELARLILSSWWRAKVRYNSAERAFFSSLNALASNSPAK